MCLKFLKKSTDTIFLELGNPFWFTTSEQGRFVILMDFTHLQNG